MWTIERSTTEAYPSIVDALSRESINESRAGDTREHLGVTIRSDNPRERLFYRDGLNLAFCLQEAFAYWNGLNPGHVERYNSNMKKFMTDGELEGSAYGRYLRHVPHDQLNRVIKQLRESPNTRQAIINFHQAGIERYDGPDVACTIYMQFLLRDDELHAITSMRSQDMLWGYPYDAHNFQWIQEVLAGVLDVDLGTYTHRLNSCHYYTEFEEKVTDTIDNYEPVEFPDIRLPRDELNTVMQYLQSGLVRARDGSIPLNQITHIKERSSFYADWLRFMTAYEQNRFHDDPIQAQKIANDIEFEGFKEKSEQLFDLTEV